MRRKKLMTAAIAAFCLMTSAAVPAGISMAAEETETETAAQETSQDESETAAQEDSTEAGTEADSEAAAETEAVPERPDYNALDYVTL